MGPYIWIFGRCETELGLRFLIVPSTYGSLWHLLLGSEGASRLSVDKQSAPGRP